MASHDIYKLDFMMTSDHIEGMTEYDWWLTVKNADLYSVPGKMINFYGCEKIKYSPPVKQYAHVNLVYPKRVIRPKIRGSVKELCRHIKTHSGLIIPHHTGNPDMGGNILPADIQIQPVIELYQTHTGSSECVGALREQQDNDPRYTVQEFLRRGLKLGFIASSDHFCHRYGDTGPALAAVFAEDLSRESIISALRARRCYATTEAKIFLDFRINNSFMGEETIVKSAPVLKIKAEGTSPIKEIVIIRNNEEIKKFYGYGKKKVTFHYIDHEIQTIDKREFFYYIRLLQEDNEIAWSSPIWIYKEK